MRLAKDGALEAADIELLWSLTEKVRRPAFLRTSLSPPGFQPMVWDTSCRRLFRGPARDQCTAEVLLLIFMAGAAC